MADPLADHEQQHLHDAQAVRAAQGHSDALKTVVYSSAGCTVAEKTFERRRGDHRGGPVSLWLDSPYQISKIVGEFYSQLLPPRHGLPIVKARFQNVYGPGRDPRRRPLARDAGHGLAQRHPDLRLPGARRARACPSRTAARRPATSSTSTTSRTACSRARRRATRGRSTTWPAASRRSIRELAFTINRLTGNKAPIDCRPQREWDRSGKRYGSTAKAEKSLGFSARVPLEEGLGRMIAWTRENLSMIDACIQRHAVHMPG